jgi:hypothetical protein
MLLRRGIICQNIVIIILVVHCSHDSKQGCSEEGSEKGQVDIDLLLLVTAHFASNY